MQLPSTLNSTVAAVTQRIIERSKPFRKAYLAQIEASKSHQPTRSNLGCGNLAHGFAACEPNDKDTIRLQQSSNIAIVTSYNDMLSAHQPYATYPDIIKSAVREMACTAQVAGGVPAMCDGVTQGEAGMELSLFSRDHIAQSTAIALSHQMFDGILCLGICDKIVPGLLIGALRFGHLPVMFVPAGPMPSGLSNKEKQRIRQLYAEKKIDRAALLQSESDAYHSAGTCTFYGTANSNQMLLEAMGLQLPGSSFVNPGTPLRQALTEEAARHITKITPQSSDYRPIAEVVDERTIVNAIIALLASGGSTNHSMHWVTIARAAGIIVDWSDFDELSSVIPLLTRIYPNGDADINHFHAAGGTGLMFNELIKAGLFHGDAKTMWGTSMEESRKEPLLDGDKIQWEAAVAASLDTQVVRPVSEPFAHEGGLKLLQGNLGRGIIKISAVAPEHRVVEAPAVVVDSQQALLAKFSAGELNKDCIVVVRFQGPKANGMPELHKLTPPLAVLQDKGFHVALVTDGRMSGASGKVPAAIQIWPEAEVGGPLAYIEEGDVIRLDATKGTLTCLVDDDVLQQRTAATTAVNIAQGVGRELFTPFRRLVNHAEHGATILFES